MSRTNRKYEVRPLSCDWALDIPLGDTTVVLYFNSRNNAELVKDILEWEDAHPNEAIPYQPTLTPPNEPLTIEQLREMDGEPVYVPETNCWVLVAKNPFVPLFTWPDGEQCSAYDWYEQVGPVYRRPPERQEDTDA